METDTTTQTLEAALKEEGRNSTEPEEVSEETTEENPEDTTEEKGKGEEPKSEEKEDKFDSRIQAEVDKRLNAYREKRESDTALIRSLSEQLKEFKTNKEVSTLERLAKTIQDGDEEEGLPEDKIEARKNAVGDVIKLAKKYSGVEEASGVVERLAAEVPKEIVDKFNLSDPNTAVRVKGMTDLIGDAVHFVKEKQAMKVFLEEIPVLQKGSEVRQQLESFIADYVELPSKKAQDLLVDKLRRDLKVTPRKKPITPSDGAGGMDLSKLSPEDRLARALDKMDKKQ